MHVSSCLGALHLTVAVSLSSNLGAISQRPIAKRQPLRCRLSTQRFEFEVVEEGFAFNHARYLGYYFKKDR